MTNEEDLFAKRLHTLSNHIIGCREVRRRGIDVPGLILVARFRWQDIPKEK